MPSTFVHGLLPTSCAWFSKPDMGPLSAKEKLRLFMAFGFLANCPDLDFIPATLFAGQFSEIHRQWGHNLFVLTAWVIFGAYLLRFVGKSRISRRACWVLSIALVGSHVFLDGMQANEESGVPLLWPISPWRFRLPFHVFHSIQIAKGQNVIYAYLTSWDFWGNIFFTEIFQTLLLLLVWVACWKLFAKLRQRSSFVA
jgi:membrane-bound metal-dependent hydrolase YbcI (DUF457 family)